MRLNSGIDYLGTLSCLDGYMNIAMEETTEHVDGQLKNHLGDAFIRGNNGTSTRARRGANASALHHRPRGVGT